MTTLGVVSSQVGGSRPLVVAAALFLSGATLGALMWTAGLSWSVSADGPSPSAALALIWVGAALVVASMLAAAFIARPSVVGRLRRSDRALGQLAEIAASVKQIEQSACEAPSRLELSGQIVRSRGQIESRLQTQQRSIDRLIRKMSVETAAPLDNADVAFSIVRPRRPTNVFVLGTGRCGTVTFSAACGHFDNFTAGHESRRGELSAARFEYPEHHIESDNRLSWFLGQLGQRFDDDETMYVHLTRSPDDVIASYTRRWNSGFRSNIGRAFGHGIVVRTEDWPEGDVESVVRFYVETVTANIEAFLEGRSAMSIQLETIDTQFPDFIDRVGATGDLRAATAELGVRHNASAAGHVSGVRGTADPAGSATALEGD